jgi:hypothetical protein
MDVQEFCAVMRRWSAIFAAPNPVGDLTEAQLKTIPCPVVLFAGNTPVSIPEFPATPPVGFSARLSDGAVDFDLVVPAPMLRDTADYVRKVIGK